MTGCVRVVVKSDTLGCWNEHNPVLRVGELASVVSHSGIGLKVGDGKTRFKDLPYLDAINALNSGYIYHSTGMVKIDLTNNNVLERLEAESLPDFSDRLEELLADM